MKSGALVFLAAFLALAASWGGFVLSPQIQLGRETQTNSIGSSALYPQARPGLAKQGAEVYRANGCVYCHSQQISQDGTRVEVVLTDAGTNATATVAAIAKINAELAKIEPVILLAGLPKVIKQVPNVSSAEATTKALTAAGAKTEALIIPFGPDIARGWGKRRSVARDYLFDYPVQPGSRRIGPDLANIGARSFDANWHLLHLYAPQIVIKGSTMPPYRFLFETRKIKGAQSSDALNLPAEFAPPAGQEIVPTEDAKILVAYLLSLHADAPLYEAPVTPPPAPAAPATNAPPSTAAAK